MSFSIVTCTDWNYRRWTTTLINSLHHQFSKRYVIAVGEGDWKSYGAQLGVTIIPQPFNHAMDPIRWCQNVRMRHLRALIEDCDYLLQVDSDVRQNKRLSLKHQFFSPKNKKNMYGHPVWVVYKHYGKKIPIGGLIGRQQVNNRFKINAGWVLYQNTSFTRNMLAEIQKEFDTNYNNEDGWDQIQLWNHLKKNAKDLVGKYIDDGAKGGYWRHAHWWHCKGPGKKETTDLESWHDLRQVPKPQLSDINSIPYRY